MVVRIRFWLTAGAFAAALWGAACQPAAAETLGEKLRRLAAAAARSNPLTNPPLLPSPAWAANHIYAAGEAVANGGNLYLCYMGGTSGPWGGPTGAGFATIYDGSAVWVYDGPVVVGAPDPTAPRISSTASAPALTSIGLTKFFNAGASPSSFAFGGGAPTSTNASEVLFPAVHSFVSRRGGNVGLDNGASNFEWSAAFLTDAPKLAIGVSNGGAPATIIIDGRKLMHGGFRGATPGNPSWFILDFTNAGGRKTRTITIQESGSVSFAGVRVDAFSTVAAPPATDRVRVAFFGSSIEAGGNGFPVTNAGAWPLQVSELLGWSDPWNLGIGGTGYIATDYGMSFNYLGHLSDGVNIRPDIVVVGGPVNDANNVPWAITGAVTQFLQALRAALPTTPVIAMGTFPFASGPSAAILNSENAVLQAVQMRRDPLMFFVPVSSGWFGPLIMGTGKTTSPKGNGNADFYISSDGGHPTQLGIDYEAFQYAARIQSIFVNTLP